MHGKKHSLDRRFSEKIIHYFKSLIRKLINEKSADRGYFTKHIHFVFDHLIGNHNNCDSFCWTSDCQFQKIEIDQKAYQEVQEYLDRFTNRVDCLKEGVTSNLTEAFFFCCL